MTTQSIKGKKTTPGRAFQQKMRWAEKAQRARLSAARRSAPQPLPDADAIELPVVQQGGVAFADVGVRQCRFPLRGRGTSLVVCGKATGEHRSYCAAHRRGAYSQKKAAPMEIVIDGDTFVL